MTNKPFYPSADRNKDPILSVFKPMLSAGQLVLEIGSGTGQHACHFSSALPDIVWQPTELETNIPAINSWLADHSLQNILSPKVLDVDVFPWPVSHADVCYTCNTFHIVSLDSVRSIFRGASETLSTGGKLCVYGPFALSGQHTSSGNEQFDQQLRASNPDSGIRDLSELDEIAQQFGFTRLQKTAMPANNFFVVWELLSNS